MEVATQSLHSLFPISIELIRTNKTDRLMPLYLCIKYKAIIKDAYDIKLTKLKDKQARSPHTISYNLWVKEDLGLQSSH